MASSIASTLSTSITDLNNDCLREVFEHLHLLDLCTVAAVCTHFKAIAQFQFATSKNKRFSFRQVDRTPTLFVNNVKNDETEARLKQISKVMHTFGAFIEAISVGDWFDKFPEIYPNEIVDLLTRFCSEKLSELEIWRLTFTDITVHKIRPVLRNLKTLNLSFCEWGQYHVLLKSLPSWSPELQELIFHQSLDKKCSFTGLWQNLPKLEKVAFKLAEVGMYVVGSFLKSNPQIIEAVFEDCYNLNDHIIRLIAKHIPQIEKLTIENIYSNGPSNLKHLGQLRNLKSLSIASINHEPVNDIHICEIDFANIPLEYLSLSVFEFTEKFDQFVSAISKLDKLKYLKLSQVNGVNSSHIVAMCKHHSHLTELHITYNERLVLSVQNMLEILQIASKLEKFIYTTPEPDEENETESKESKNVEEHIWIDGDAYKKFVNVLQNRCRKIYLSISSHLYHARQIPYELVKLNKHRFELKLEEHEYCEEEEDDKEDEEEDNEEDEEEDDEEDEEEDNEEGEDENICANDEIEE